MLKSGQQPDQQGSPILRVCLIQAYRAPSYIRGTTLKAALTSTEAVSLSLAMNCSAGTRRYWEAIRDLLRVRREYDPDIYILAFRGHEIAWLIRRLTHRRLLVFDAMMSPYAALAEEHKVGTLGRLLALLWKPFERAALVRADAILTDTQAHSEYYQARFGISAKKIIVIPMGAIESPLGLQRLASSSGPLRILFYGSFLPLHGIDVVLDAADMLQDVPLFFDFIGGTRQDALKLGKRLGQHGDARFSHRTWVPFETLLETDIPAADLCLGGPFGDTPQAQRVVTGKTHQCIASGRATVVGKIDEDCGFIDKVNCLLVEQGNAAALASAIRWAHENKALLPAIGTAGRRLHEKRYSVPVIGKQLVEALSRLSRADDCRARG